MMAQVPHDIQSVLSDNISVVGSASACPINTRYRYLMIINKTMGTVYSRFDSWEMDHRIKHHRQTCTHEHYPIQKAHLIVFQHHSGFSAHITVQLSSSFPESHEQGQGHHRQEHPPGYSGTDNGSSNQHTQEKTQRNAKAINNRNFLETFVFFK